MKQGISILLACLLMASLCSACGPSPSEAESSPPSIAESPAVTTSETPPPPALPEGTELRNGKLWFTQRRDISVMLYERDNAAVPPDGCAIHRRPENHR